MQSNMMILLIIVLLVYSIDSKFRTKEKVRFMNHSRFTSKVKLQDKQKMMVRFRKFMMHSKSKSQLRMKTRMRIMVIKAKKQIDYYMKDMEKEIAQKKEELQELQIIKKSGNKRLFKEWLKKSDMKKFKAQKEEDQEREKEMENQREYEIRLQKKNKKEKQQQAVFIDGSKIDQETGKTMSHSLFNEEFKRNFKKELVYSFYLKKMDQSSLPTEKVGPRYVNDYLKEVEVKINKYGLYYGLKNEIGIDGLMDMIRLDELITKEEVRQLKEEMPSLEKIENIRLMEEQNDQGQKGQFPCLRIRDDASLSWWIICDRFEGQFNYEMQSTQFGGDMEVGEFTSSLGTRLQQFRTDLIQKVISNIEIKNNLKYTTVIQDLGDSLEESKEDGYEGWQYPDNWGGSCQFGLQSPIDIREQDILVNSAQIQIITGYDGDPKTVAVRGNNDYFLVGNFGYVLYQNQFKGINNFFCPWKIEFKYSSEHQFDSESSMMEILVYHKQSFKEFRINKDMSSQQDCERVISELDIHRVYDRFNYEKEERQFMGQNTDLIVSFMVNVDINQKIEEDGVFWQGLSQVSFKGSKKNEEIIVEKKKRDNKMVEYMTYSIIGGNSMNEASTLASLEGLIDDGLNTRFKHSFITYEGSISQPSCNQNVNRVVFTEPISVSEENFTILKDKVLEGFKSQNHRSVQNQGSSRLNYKIYKHIDTSNKQICPTRQILSRFINKDLNSLMSDKEIIDYNKLIEDATILEKKYSHMYKYFTQSHLVKKVDKRIQNNEVQFNYLAKIQTDINHIHKIPMKLAQKLFNQQSEIKQGNQVNIENGDNSIKVTFLGKSNPYKVVSTQQSDSKVAQAIDKANSLIQKQDREYIQEGKYDKTLTLSDKQIENAKNGKPINQDRFQQRKQ